MSKNCTVVKLISYGIFYIKIERLSIRLFRKNLVSDDLKKTTKKNIEGEITILEAGKLIESYYNESKEKDTDRTKEADTCIRREKHQVGDAEIYQDLCGQCGKP